LSCAQLARVCQEKYVKQMKVLIGGQTNGKNNVKRIIVDGAYDSDENFRFFVSK